MAKIIETLLRHWSGESAPTIAPPVSLEAISNFERQFGLVLPAELREYYREFNGFGLPNDQDQNGFSFWPLEKVVRVSDYKKGAFAFRGAEQCFLFADYLGLSWTYAFRLSSGGNAPICVVGTSDRQPIWIAESFADFVKLYVEDSSLLYAGGALDG